MYEKKRRLIKRRRCQYVIDDGLFSGEEKKCGRLVKNPNKFLCDRCLRHAESLEQIVIGVEK